MKPIKQYIKVKKTKKNERKKSKLFHGLSRFIKQENNFTSIEVKELGNKIGLTEETSLEYAKQWRRTHSRMMVINILHRVHLSEQSYIQYNKSTGRKKAYATHYSITIPKNIFFLLEKFASFRYDKNGEPYLWIDERRFFSKDSLRNAKNFFKVLRKWIDKQTDIHDKDIHTHIEKTNKILNKGIKPKKTGALQHIAKKSWKTINQMIKDAEQGLHPDFEQVSTNCTPYIYKQYTFSYTYINKSILSSRKTQQFTKKLNKLQIKKRYFEKKYKKKNQEIYKQNMLNDFRNLLDACIYNCGVGDFTKSPLHKRVLQENSGSMICIEDRRVLFVNIYKKFRHDKYGIDKKKTIILKEEIEIIREWRKR